MVNFLKDDKGNDSSLRLVWSISVLIIMVVWGMVSLECMELQHFTTGDVMWFTVLLGSKLGQKYIETGLGGKQDAVIEGKE